MDQVVLVCGSWFFEKNRWFFEKNRWLFAAVQAIDSNQFEVTNESMMHVVNLSEKKCSCRRFDLEKLPCVHAIAAAFKAKKSRISLADLYFNVTYLRRTYHASVSPRDPNTSLPTEVATQEVNPPLVRQPPGRPRNGRMKSAFEIGVEKKRPRKQGTCLKCNGVGHNIRT